MGRHLAPTLCLLVACIPGELRLSGRACPCLDDWVCDDATQTCVREVAKHDDGAIDVVSFSAGWATPNWIRWEWELDGAAKDFAAFNLVIGASEEDVVNRTDVRIVTGETNPELNHFLLPRTGGDDPVRATHTDEHVHSTDYFAQLVVIDTAGRSSTSHNVARQRTAIEPQPLRIEVFEEVSRFGFSFPDCAAPEQDQAHVGETAFTVPVYCADSINDGECVPTATPDAVCWQNVNLGGVGIDMAAALPPQHFDDAYLELAVRVDDSPQHFWATFGVHTGSGIADYQPLTIRADGAYRVHQLPLAAFGASYADYGGLFDGINLGSDWADGATIRVDSVFVRW